MSWRSGSRAFSVRWNTEWGTDKRVRSLARDEGTPGTGRWHCTCNWKHQPLHGHCICLHKSHASRRDRTPRPLPAVKQQSINLHPSFPKGKNLQIKSTSFTRTNKAFISLGHTLPLARDTYYPPNKTDAILFTASCNPGSTQNHRHKSVSSCFLRSPPTLAEGLNKNMKLSAEHYLKNRLWSIWESYNIWHFNHLLKPFPTSTVVIHSLLNSTHYIQKWG